MGWDAVTSMIEQWTFFLEVLWGPPEKHCTLYKLMLMIDAAEEVNSQLLEKERHQPTMPAALVQLIKTEFNERCKQVFTRILPVM